MKTKKRSMALSTSELTGLRCRVRHRLDNRLELLDPREFHFLNQMYEQLATMTSISHAQLEWLLAILERTKTKWGR